MIHNPGPLASASSPAAGTTPVQVAFDRTLEAGTYSLQFSAKDATGRILATSSLYASVSSGQIVSFDVPACVFGWPIVTANGKSYGPVGASLRLTRREIHLPVVLKQ
jgi:hypothetical protein